VPRDDRYSIVLCIRSTFEISTKRKIMNMHQASRNYLALSCVGIALLIASAQSVEASLLDYPHLIPNDPDQSVLLSDLLNGELPGIVVGDKVFNEFFYSTLPNDDMPEPEDVKVFGFQDNDGHLGISFHGVFWDLPGGGPSDALIRFTVAVSRDGLAEGYQISDAHLYMEGSTVGDNSFLAIDESFQGLHSTLSTHSSTLGGGSSEKINDWVYFDRLYNSLRVTKDILAFSGDDQVPARTSIIDQSFSQTVVPEPATLLVFAVFGMGMASTRRFPPRRKS
jgi:hypothetical protein